MTPRSFAGSAFSICAGESSSLLKISSSLRPLTSRASATASQLAIVKASASAVCAWSASAGARVGSSDRARLSTAWPCEASLIASHAAVVARGWGIPAVVGAADVRIGEGRISIGGLELELQRDGALRDRERGVAWSDDTIVRIYSMTKPLVSVAVMQLQVQPLLHQTELLGPDPQPRATLQDWLPAWVGERRATLVTLNTTRAEFEAALRGGIQSAFLAHTGAIVALEE